MRSGGSKGGLVSICLRAGWGRWEPFPLGVPCLAGEGASSILSLFSNISLLSVCPPALPRLGSPWPRRLLCWDRGVSRYVFTFLPVRQQTPSLKLGWERAATTGWAHSRLQEAASLVGPFCPPPSREDETGLALPAVLQHPNSFSLQPGSLQPPCSPRSIRATTLLSCLCPLLQGLLTSPVPSQTTGAAIPGSRSFSFSLTSVLKVGRTCPKYQAQESKLQAPRPPRSQLPFSFPPSYLEGTQLQEQSKMDVFFSFFGLVSGQHPVSFLDVCLCMDVHDPFVAVMGKTPSRSAAMGHPLPRGDPFQASALSLSHSWTQPAIWGLCESS